MHERWLPTRRASTSSPPRSSCTTVSGGLTYPKGRQLLRHRDIYASFDPVSPLNDRSTEQSSKAGNKPCGFVLALPS